MSEPNQWVIEKNKGWKVWWQLMRPHTLTASFIPVILGTALALPESGFEIGLFIAMMVASLLIQAATNMFNEYFDFKRGLDTEESIGIGGTIVRDGVSPKTVLYLGYSFCLVAILIGVYICMQSSWWLALIGLVCMMTGYLYTGGPYPIAYTPFGELISGIFMGSFLVLISFYIQTGQVTTSSILISIPSALLVGGIMLANNIRDLESDCDKGRQTLAILLGRRQAINLLSGLFVFSYIWIVALIITSAESIWMLLVLVSVPKAFQAAKSFKQQTQKLQMMLAMKSTAQTNTMFGGLLSLGLIIDYIIR
ncbi:1,4-dihydroxy-2-naphthoate polyprenyltransferase [Tuberibacillus sp. Marseille-P3662]|uniref:1,4-dihydroxy-2-naphthoate polyprenyltransferase n=1 Tax=Tuberibacillus sp. Marseille-P3662 TaxID=1965358 RepID=UPI000A1C99AB|nr:1,4-dihydroxy-2-naphthoate polyprenyltransferase [Tuberibacillus sp. Marseille-P3662]